MKKIFYLIVLSSLISLYANAQVPSSPQNALKFIWGDQDKNGFVGRIVYGAYADANAAAGDADVVFIGDSITQNWYMFHHSFFDDNGFLARGISGQTSIEILCRFQQDVVAHHPKVVVMMIGTNDVARNAGIISDECYLANIASCCDIAKANDIKMLLCSIPPCDKFSWNQDITPGSEIIRLNEKLQTYAAENGIRYVDFFSVLSNGKDGMKDEYTNDRCHPTPAGYDVMEKLILEEIGKTLGKGKFNVATKADKSTVEYVVRDGKPILMDIYQIKGQKTEGKRPVFLYSFGGAWAMGSRVDDLCNPLYDHLCEKGWVCVAIDYRLGSARGRDGKPLITPPEGYNAFQYSIDIGVEDIYAAATWLVQHSDEYNIDPEKIVISGSSAGAINSMNAEYYICSGHELAKNNLPADFNFAGVVPMAGAVYLTGESDTELKWDKKPCPMCFFHGSADPTVTYDVENNPSRHGFGPFHISKQLDTMDVPYILNEYYGGDHVNALLALKWFWNEIDSFLDRIVLGGQNIKLYSVEKSDKPRTDPNWLDTVRPGQYQAVNMRKTK